MTDHVINTVLAIASGVFFATVMNMLRTVGADLWAAVVLGLAATWVLLMASGTWARRRSAPGSRRSARSVGSDTHRVDRSGRRRLRPNPAAQALPPPFAAQAIP